MNWIKAVEKMRGGACVQRASEKRNKLIDDGEMPVYQSGIEPIRLAAAWTDKEEPVFVFQGAWSQQMFVPDEDCRDAEDWETVA